MSLPDLQHLMHQLGPVTPEIETIIQHDTDSWQVSFDDGISIQVGWQDFPPRVLISCAIGRPSSAVREAVYASLLNANLLLTGVASVKLALSEPEEDVMLIGEYDGCTSALDTLRQRMQEFLQFAARFSHMISGAGPVMLPPSAASPVQAPPPFSVFLDSA